MNIKRFNGNDFPGDKWVRDILSRVNEIIDYLKRKVGFDRLSDEVTEVLAPLTSVGTDGQVLTSTGTEAQWESLPTATATVQGVVKGGEVPGSTSGGVIATGFIGQKIDSSVITSSVAGTGSGFPSSIHRRLTLDKGVYLILSHLAIAGFSGNVGNFVSFLGGTATILEGSTYQTTFCSTNSAMNSTNSAYAVISTNGQTVELNGVASGGGSTISGTVTFGGRLVAVRIA